MTEVGQLIGAKLNTSAETMKEVIKFEAELAKVKNFHFYKVIKGLAQG